MRRPEWRDYHSNLELFLEIISNKFWLVQCRLSVAEEGKNYFFE